MEFKSKTEARNWAEAFARSLRRSSAVLLSGPMGAGKTQLVRWMLEALKSEEVQSPTFAIHQQYQTASGLVDHLDLYRLKSDADLESSGFWDLLKSTDALVFIEWADRLPENVWPKSWKKYFIEVEKTSTEEGRILRIRESGGL